MLASGALEETRGLLERWGPEAPALGGVGYKQLLPAVADANLLPECLELWKRDTRRYAKRQLTWFRHQLAVHWLDARRLLAELGDEVESRWLAETAPLHSTN
jgi:tRNA dimethylallyltransferase